jgi:hypothetical protein
VAVPSDAARPRRRFWQAVPTYHPRTLTARARLATLTGEAGDRAVAREQFAALLSVLRKVLGDQHPDTRAASDNLAYWTQAENSR